MKNNLIKANIKDIERLAEFASLNSYNEYEAFLDKKEFYKEMLNEFIKNNRMVYYAVDGEQLSGMIFFKELPFDTNLFGVKTAQLTDITTRKAEIAEMLINLFLKWAEENKMKFLQCRLDSRYIHIAQILEKSGFRIVCEDVSFSRGTEEISLPHHPYSVVLGGKQDLEALYILSKGLYKTSRFHKDLNIPEEKANEMQALRLKNTYDQKLADEIIILKESKEIAGYVVCKILDEGICKKEAKTGSIELIAVKTAFQGKGIGSILIQESLKWFKEQNCRFVAVATQAINLPAIKLYQKNGFKLENTLMAFHRWPR